jgi:alpha-L-fucosidase
MLYAVALGWPEDGQLLVRSLGKSDSAPGSKVTKVSLLGYKGTVEWRQTPDGLSVKLPAQKLSPYTSALKITGTDLKPVPLKDESAVIQQDHKGNFLLGAASADIHGDQVNTEERDGQTNLGFWDKPADWVSWKVRVQKPGKFAVSASIATINEGAEVALEAGQGKVTGPIPRTGDWGTFQVADLGQIYISGEGEQVIKLHPKDAATWKPINLRFIRLTRSD